MTENDLSYDVTIVGGGVSGLSTAIALKQAYPAASVALFEKGSEVGAHILSGAAIIPEPLDELWPAWREEFAAHQATPVTSEAFYYLTEKSAWRMPLLPLMRNHGSLMLSMSQLCRYLGGVAEKLGVEVYPGFPAAACLFDEDNRVIGIQTKEFGVTREGEQGPQYQPGVNCFSRYTVLAEGARGFLSEKIIRHYRLRTGHQTYALGVKEVWRVNPDRHREGHLFHSTGWPLDGKTYGGSFVYHCRDNIVSLGFAVGLDYRNPTLSPFSTLQQFKRHPQMASLLEGGERLAYGARVINEGGWQALPQLEFPGGLLVGCAAGMVNVPKIKGVHNATRSGLLAGHHLAALLKGEQTVMSYDASVRHGSIGKELYRVRNIRPAFRYGTVVGMLYAGLDFLCKGGCWSFVHHRDREQTQSLEVSGALSYPKPDQKLTFDRLTSLALANVHHEENQPIHLKLLEPEKAMAVNGEVYGSPEQYYCPASVYEVVGEGQTRHLVINAQNCIHCKACDIKDPTGNIVWTLPQGGGGPNYQWL